MLVCCCCCCCCSEYIIVDAEKILDLFCYDTDCASSLIALKTSDDLVRDSSWIQKISEPRNEKSRSSNKDPSQASSRLRWRGYKYKQATTATTTTKKNVDINNNTRLLLYKQQQQQQQQKWVKSQNQRPTWQ